ncbi:glycosyltransferase [Clostridium sp. WILCCON 0269]|uniref:Glycosyltransferase n=1 Tax=Candidatus Clostridium eludens TaxID=3381663 RepID=A0ABW8SFA4_9CLOT
MSVKVSIIVPVYNSEKYIEECVNSLLSQTLTYIEIILVDDGSEDKSLAICRNLGKKDLRIKVISQANEGVSSARNSGMEIASGEFIGFVDSDDKVLPDMYEIMVNKASEENAEVVSCAYCVIKDGKIEIICSGNDSRVLSSEESVRCVLLNERFGMSACNKIFKREVIGETRFHVGKRINEDRFFVFQALMNSNRNVCINDAKYLYLIHENSTTTSQFNGRWFDSIFFAEKMQKIVLTQFPKLADEALYNVLVTSYRVTTKIIDSGEKDKYIEKYCELIGKIKEVDLKRIDQFASRQFMIQCIIVKYCNWMLRFVRKAFAKK